MAGDDAAEGGSEPGGDEGVLGEDETCDPTDEGRAEQRDSSEAEPEHSPEEGVGAEAGEPFTLGIFHFAADEAHGDLEHDARDAKQQEGDEDGTDPEDMGWFNKEEHGEHEEMQGMKKQEGEGGYYDEEEGGEKDELPGVLPGAIEADDWERDADGDGETEGGEEDEECVERAERDEGGFGGGRAQGKEGEPGSGSGIPVALQTLERGDGRVGGGVVFVGVVDGLDVCGDGTDHAAMLGEDDGGIAGDVGLGGDDGAIGRGRSDDGCEDDGEQAADEDKSRTRGFWLFVCAPGEVNGGPEGPGDAGYPDEESKDHAGQSEQACGEGCLHGEHFVVNANPVEDAGRDGEVRKDEDGEETGDEREEIEGGVAGDDGEESPGVAGEETFLRGEVVAVPAEPADGFGLDGGVGEAGLAGVVGRFDVGEDIHHLLDGVEGAVAFDPGGEELMDVAASGDGGEVIELADEVIACEALEDAEGKGGAADSAAGEGEAGGVGAGGDEVGVVFWPVEQLFGEVMAWPLTTGLEFLFEEPFAGGVFGDDGQPGLELRGTVEG